ncbi:hypothetical protein [Robertmurraya siralis]|uniref:hypothetical protein n=1 Tax=Robertmurraya siralis TaxID=77777 RepID=UPI0010F71A6E|nr:hypothetical protein [Robertmurraya siralis]
MAKIEWDTFLTDFFSGVAVLIFGALIGWITGFLQGKKKSSLGIERKNEIYQPLLDELFPLSQFECNVLITQEVPILKEIVTNEYKYGLSKELQGKCNNLFSLIEQFNKINLVSIAHNKIMIIFQRGYEEIFGSIVEGVSIHTDREGNEWEEEHIALPIELIRRGDFEKDIISLLNKEEMYDYEVCVDRENSNYVPVYGDLVYIYDSVLNATINGESHKLPPLKRELNMSPAEYIALHYDFFEIFNEDKQKLLKFELREEINLKSQEIIDELKGIIRKIVKTYEIEEI